MCVVVRMKNLECPICNSPQADIAYASQDIYFCRSCKTAFVAPQPTLDELQEYYTSELDPSYLHKYREIGEKKAEIFFGYSARKFEKGRVLDIGCGNGYFLNFFKSKGWDCSGVEYSHSATNYCRNEFDLDVLQGDFMTTTLAGPYDCVSAQHVLEHMNSPYEFIQRIREILTPQGILLLAVPNYNSLLRRMVGSNWVCLAEKTHLFHYTINSLKTLLGNSGFRAVNVLTMQIDMADVLWALKMTLFPRQRKIVRPNNKNEASKCRSVEKPLTKSGIISISAIFRPLINKLGLGSEILAIFQKI